MTDAPVLHLSGPVLLGPDEVVAEAWVVGGRLTLEGPRADAQRVDGWVVPGLVDAHCHVGLGPGGGVDDARAEQQAVADRDAGALLLRDAGSPVDTRWVQQRDDLPELIRAGRHLARPRRYIRGLALEVEPDDLPAAVAEQAAAGDGWVKLVGDWIDRETGDLAPLWSREAAEAAIAAAHAAGARVTAHCFAEDSLRDLAEAGIDCVEHATGLTDDTIALFADRGVAIVPTLVNIALFPGIAAQADEKFPAYAAHMRDLHARRFATVRSAYEAGIAVYCGTDAGGQLAHGRVAHEVLALHEAGLPPLAALDAACWGARCWLGRPSLAEGERADAVVLDADPRTELETLLRPRLTVLRGLARPASGPPLELGPGS